MKLFKTDKNKSINVALRGNRKILPLGAISNTISASEQYTKEREECDKVRLTCQVNVVASNVLCNDITEIVRNEGSKDVVCYNFKNDQDAQSLNVVGKNISLYVQGMRNEYQTYEMIRDTQVSAYGNNISFFCGKDIFNNHILRNNTFKTTNASINTSSSPIFNTIDDFLRETVGKEVLQVEDSFLDKDKIQCHSYKYEDIDTFDEAIEKKLISSFEGWIGFNNTSKIKIYGNDNGNPIPLDINKIMNNRDANEFIDMYPTRELFGFVPLYNKERKRMEKNWNYCLTYPSSSTTEDFMFFEQNVQGSKPLKAVYFDDNTKNDSGGSQIVIYSITKHGLRKGDFVNVYKTYIKENKPITERALNKVRVSNIVDDYIFVVNGGGMQISDKWYDVKEIKETFKNTHNVNGSFVTPTDPSSSDRFFIVNGRVNMDITSQNISFKKVIGDQECDYYIRVFSKIPNFKYADSKIDEFKIKSGGNDFLKKYQGVDNDFENHISKNAFSKNIYGDPNGLLVFTDDIDLSYLKDNLGRPLSTIYLTFIKNNKGYKEWYGVDEAIDLKSDNIEFSHCFGKINCGLKLSDYSVSMNGLTNINTVNNATGGSSAGSGNSLKPLTGLNGDEIVYEEQIHFYGDLVCYNPSTLEEEILQPFYHRYNTMQRELSGSDSTKPFFSTIYVNNITSDDYDFKGFATSKEMIKIQPKKEGYYYQPHYEINLHTFGDIEELLPRQFTVRQMEIDSTGSGKAVVVNDHNLEKGNIVTLYDTKDNIVYECMVDEIVSRSVFKFTCRDESNVLYSFEPIEIGVIKHNNNGIRIDTTEEDNKNRLRYKLIDTAHIDAPSYVRLAKDGTCRCVWRPLIKNGTDINNDNVEQYPFTNGALYINKNITIYNRRQDPEKKYGLYSVDGLPDLEGRIPDVNEINDSFDPLEIEC